MVSNELGDGAVKTRPSHSHSHQALFLKMLYMKSIDRGMFQAI